MKTPLPLSTLKKLAFLFGIFLNVCAFSQTINLTGTVKNANSAAVADVKVSLKSHANISTTTNSSGNFTLSGTITGIPVVGADESISFEGNGIVRLNVKNEPLRIDIISVSGQLLCTVINTNRINGQFKVDASAYVPQNLNIYIVRVIVGNIVKSTKFIPENSNAVKGLIEISSNTPTYVKSQAATADSLVLTHNDYKTKKILINTYSGSLGTITMENAITVPATPGNLTTTVVSTSQINLSWTDNSTNETSFNIERAPGGTTTFTEIATVGAGVTTYQNTGLTASTSYVYRVRAYNSAGYSGYTSTSTATTSAPPLTIPTAPTGLTTTVISSTQINLNWTDNSSNETTFNIERAAGGTTTFTEIATVGAGVTTYQNTGLTASTSYVYRVRAYNSAGYSVYTSTSTATTSAPPVTLPVAPSSLTATAASATQINLSWTDNSNNETTFNIERAPGGTTTFTEIATVGAGVTTYQNTGLTASTGYTYRVRAYNSAGYSGYTNTSTATTSAAQNPATLRIKNSTHYPLISIKINGVEQLAYKNVLPIGNSVDYTFASGGSVTYSILIGLMDSNGATIDFYTFNGTVQVVAGQVYTLNCLNPTLAQVLTVFSASKVWSGYYFDANSNYHTCSYTFYSDGSFRLYDGTTLIGTGTATLVTWEDYATIISFKLGTTETIQMMYPFASFMQSNGPASWKVITYTEQ